MKLEVGMYVRYGGVIKKIKELVAKEIKYILPKR
jgi:hypothetical protein